MTGGRDTCPTGRIRNGPVSCAPGTTVRHVTAWPSSAGRVAAMAPNDCRIPSAPRRRRVWRRGSPHAENIWGYVARLRWPSGTRARRVNGRERLRLLARCVRSELTFWSSIITQKKKVYVRSVRLTGDVMDVSQVVPTVGS
jgi:hypothetical protein